VAGERARSRGTAPAAAARQPATTTRRAARGELPSPEDPQQAKAQRRWKPRTRHTSSSSRAASTGWRRWTAPVAALVLALAVLGSLVGVSLRDPGAQARTDRAAASQARTSIEQMLSYNYKSIDAQAARIEGLLTGSFKGEFTAAMDKEIKPMAVKNQTVVSAKVSDIGVMSSSPTTVKVLAFVNQARVASGQSQPVVDQNRVMATMAKVGDRWLVSKVEAF
jgi:Mce-associated membrane protein